LSEAFWGNNVSDPALVQEWKESVNGRASSKLSVGESQRGALVSTQHRLEAPSYYAANAQILIHGECAMLLFTRPHPALLPNRNIAPGPLREPVAIIEIDLGALKNLSQATAEAIRRVEGESRQTGMKSVLKNSGQADVIRADDSERAASSGKASPRRRRGLGAWLIGTKRCFCRS
jgi:hypothetical protein